MMLELRKCFNVNEKMVPVTFFIILGFDTQCEESLCTHNNLDFEKLARKYIFFNKRFQNNIQNKKNHPTT